MGTDDTLNSSPSKAENAMARVVASPGGECSIQKEESVPMTDQALQLVYPQAGRLCFDGKHVDQNLCLYEEKIDSYSAKEKQNHSKVNVGKHSNERAPRVYTAISALPSTQRALQPSFLLTNGDRMERAHMQQVSKGTVNISPDEEYIKYTNTGSSRVLPCIGAYTVQCALCMKWRLIPTKEQYEEIRQSVSENPFFCSSTASWRPNISCEDPSDVMQDDSHLWAIDRPNIPAPPPGWDRQLVFRGAGASKFADVYYVAPSGRKLRSTPEVERFLTEFPEYAQGARISQFSFVIPKPLDRDYCRKKSAELSSYNLKAYGKSQDKKLSAKRKAFQRLSSKELSKEHLGGLDIILKASGIIEKSFSGTGMDPDHHKSIHQHMVEGSLPPEKVTKGLVGLPGNLKNAEFTSTANVPDNTS
ncbi:hypothetical protein KP509_39G057100 [Ceratopteris richardii]|uniref:Uncharacterized protein n=1 Tax=Ceratopteris richardii TaxID=49495 RepID=A0A8T2Q1T8_CERRI|nr:hypothetical protein KP509_39G057100 [Ceratopteris richardii]KAH7277562.1 hypothetical protein KP509_39G057100 [Ceratopteris richardii]KAH7277563.1 hypothetical protein KP509_39G057100 [Ceratopteris richardii]